MIKICFKDSDSSKKGSPVKEEKKGAASTKSSNNGKIQIVTSQLGGKTKKKKSPNTSKDSGSADDVISLKYTIDYPRVELHPFDTRKF